MDFNELLVLSGRLESFCDALRFYWSFPTDEDNRNDRNPGGYLTILDKTSGQVLISLQLTNDQSLSAEEAESYRGYSLEKAQRLFRHLQDGHLTSYESRDLENHRYGGAIAVDAFIVSFSGLPEKWDTIVVSIGCCLNGWMDGEGLTLKEIAIRAESPELLRSWKTTKSFSTPSAE
jgi:hypothetical protein